MDASMDELSIEIESTTQNSVKAIDLLIGRLDNLRVSLQNIVKEAGNFSNLKKDLEDISKNIGGKTTSNQTTPFANYGNLEQQLRYLGVDKDKLGLTEGKSLDENYARLTNRIKTTNEEISKYVLNNNKVVTISQKTKGELNGVKVTLKEVGDEVNKSGNKWEKLKNVFTGVGAKLTGVYLFLRKATTKIAEWIKESANYQESLNLFMVTMGENAKEAKEWVDMFSEALYLDPSNVMQYMGSFNSLTKGLGVGADRAYLMSKNLTQLTYDLASFKNLNFDTAFRKLQSAMSGEIEPLRNVGVALSQATLQQLAYSLGIEKNVADMTEAEKAQLRYIQIMKSSTEWQTDMGRTLVTPANALRVIKQQFTLLARAIGNVFIPVLMAAIPYIMVITKALTALANRLADLLGFKLADIDYSKITSGLGGIGDGIEDIGDEAGKTADKLNTMLAPFDELNVVQQESKKKGKGYGNDDIFDSLDLGLPEYDALAGLTDKFKNNMADAEKKLKEILPIVEGIAGAFALWKITESVANFMTWWSNLSGGGQTVARIGFGVILTFAGFTLAEKGGKDVLNENTLLQGIAEQIGGSITAGIGAGIITKSVPIGIFISLATLGFESSKTASTGSTAQGLFGSFGQIISSLGAGALAFKMSGGNPIITLTVTALVTWANVLFDLAKLAELKPTGDELYNAIFEQLNPFYDIGNWIGDNILTPLYNLIVSVETWKTEFWEAIGGTFTGNFKPFDKWWKKTKKGFSDTWDSILKSTGINLDEMNKNVGVDMSSMSLSMKGALDGMDKDNSEKWEKMKKDSTKASKDTSTDVSKQWENLKTNTSNIWNDISTSLSEKWQGVKDAASDKWGDIKTAITDKWNEAKNWFETHIGSRQWWKEKFNSIVKGAQDVLNDLSSKFNNWSAYIKTPHISWDSNGIKAKEPIKSILKALNLPTTLPKLSVSWYAEGGFPKDGEFFFANEQGPEMIGRIGNKSAVANNDQITESITNALLTALNNYDFGGSKGPTTIYIGNKKVYEGYGEYANSENDRYGTNMIRI